MFIVIIGLPLFIWIQFFEVPNKVKLGEEKLQQNPETHVFEKMEPFEHTYIGDTTRVRKLFSALPLNKYKNTIEIEQDESVLIVNYESSVDALEKQAKQAVIYNATAAFALIVDLETIDMRFEEESYIVTRDHVERRFGTTLVDFKEPDVFKRKVQDHLRGDIDPWLVAYTEGE